MHKQLNKVQMKNASKYLKMKNNFKKCEKKRDKFYTYRRTKSDMTV